MSTDVNNGARKREQSDVENSVSDVESDKLIVSSNEEDDDTDGECEAISDAKSLF